MSSSFGPGKVILLGEHGVVYGHPALAAPLTVGVTATARPADGCRLVVPQGLPPVQAAQLEEAFGRAALQVGAPSVEVSLKSALPVSMGLGSSAAVAVALSRALLTASDQPASVAAVCKLAFGMEQVFHGKPSGVDHTTSARGELLRFRRAGTRVQVRAVKAKVPFGLVVVLLGQRPPTKATVAALRERQARWPTRYERLFAAMGKGVDEGVAAIESGDLEALGDVMNVNQGLLGALGLSSARIDGVVGLLRGAGAWGAKLTGAGGDGGALLALGPKPEALRRAMKRQGLQSFVTRIGT